MLKSCNNKKLFYLDLALKQTIIKENPLSNGVQDYNTPILLENVLNALVLLNKVKNMLFVNKPNLFKN